MLGAQEKGSYHLYDNKGNSMYNASFEKLGDAKKYMEYLLERKEDNKMNTENYSVTIKYKRGAIHTWHFKTEEYRENYIKEQEHNIAEIIRKWES